MKLTRKQFLCALPAAALALAGCGEKSQPANTESLVFSHHYTLDYAQQFTADCYEGGYTMLTLPGDGSKFLVVPEDAAEVDNLPADVTVLRQPLNDLYLVSTSVMDLILHLDALDSIALSGTKAEGWYLPEAKQAMEDGRIAYAGKYSAPDYEQILAAGCSLAIENTMILHTPDVKEQLEHFGIPVLVERSSYESGPLARMEWIKFFGILLGKEHMMFPRTFSLLDSETRTLPKNTAAVESLCQRYPGRVNVLLAPAASAIYPENVPANAPLLDEDAYLDQLSAAVQAAGGRFVDVRQTLSDHKSEYIYYRTDHHWTSLGAYYAYSQLCDALGLVPFDTAAHTALTAGNFYGTHYSKARTWNAVPDTITYYDLPNPLTIYNVTAAGQPADGETTGLYDTDKLNVYDKYAMFLHGNNGLSRIEGDGTGKILVIKDSYANCFAPYLTANYAQIDIVDFRNYNYGLDQLIADNGYDQILVLYSFDSFKSDPYLYRAGVTG